MFVRRKVYKVTFMIIMIQIIVSHPPARCNRLILELFPGLTHRFQLESVDGFFIFSRPRCRSCYTKESTMEFETHPHTPEEQADLSARAKKLTLQPISTMVVPEIPEGAEINNRLSETAHTANPANDSEDTSTQQRRNAMRAQPATTDTSHPGKRTLVVSTAGLCLFAAAFLWVLTQ